MHLHRFHNDAKKPCPAARDPSVLPIDVSPGASLVTQMSPHSGIQLKGRPPPRTAACTVTLLTALLSYAPRHNLNVFEDHLGSFASISTCTLTVMSHDAVDGDVTAQKTPSVLFAERANHQDILQAMNVSFGPPDAERANAAFVNPTTLPNKVPHKSSSSKALHKSSSRKDTLQPMNMSFGLSDAERVNADCVNPVTLPNKAPHKSLSRKDALWAINIFFGPLDTEHTNADFVNPATIIVDPATSKYRERLLPLDAKPQLLAFIPGHAVFGALSLLESHAHWARRRLPFWKRSQVNTGVDGAWKILESAAKHHDLLQLTVTEGFKRNVIWMYQADRALTYGNTIQGPNPQLRILFYRIAYLLTFPIRVVFVFDGPARPEIKRGTNVLARGHPLTSPFQKLIEVFGYHWHTAPGEAEAELGQLSDLSIIDLVITTDIDALIFWCKNLDDFGIRGCGIGLAHAVARGGLGDSLLSKALEHPDDTPEFLLFLTTWKTALALEFATDPHGYLGSRRKLIAATINHTTSFPDLAPDLGRMASFCQLQFGWNAGQVSSKFIKLVYSGIVLQSLLKPYDLHALLEAHVNSGFSSDGVFPRSSVLCVLEAKALSGSSLTQYRVEISTGALGLQVKPGLRDASAFPSATLMCTWIPASVIDYALPDLVSRSKSVANLKRKAKHSRKKLPHPQPGYTPWPLLLRPQSEKDHRISGDLHLYSFLTMSAPIPHVFEALYQAIHDPDNPDRPPSSEIEEDLEAEGETLPDDGEEPAAPFDLAQLREYLLEASKGVTNETEKEYK
ncbi:hypothetical protein B0H14DRAFT_2565125, partial [Mycena olivaceomarginata]